ncbi:MAG TPA: antibiotic biosynthesis monooxygenase family protein, partial [Dehalococcoidia bacterium]|nr:antibiotic biosynthesis monooxygenase family protein [Dehalococcoidia bacterium]
MPLLTTVDIRFASWEAEQAFLDVYQQMEQEVKGVSGCLDYRVYRGPDRLYLFFVVWEDREAVQRWVHNEFHQTTLMANFRKWCKEGWFGYWDSSEDRPRARKCMQCGRWTQAEPGWGMAGPSRCRNCGESVLPADH